MMDAITSTNPEKRSRGNKILKNVARLIKAKKTKRNKDAGLDVNEFDEFKEFQ